MRCLGYGAVWGICPALGCVTPGAPMATIPLAAGPAPRREAGREEAPANPRDAWGEQSEQIVFGFFLQSCSWLLVPEGFPHEPKTFAK